ncbi:MAG TPA: carboxypeptidase regulatory-like domain-containing protein, partial [Candidatus Wallbacteria bacterium]|nr:carboxypeptidase regulatory-like domain-containing protein [Candidatus Wallbacteria bacterium]
MLAGYLTDDSAAAPVMQKSQAPLAGKEVRVVCGNQQYFTVTDSSGFFKLDLKAGPSEAPVYIEFLTASGAAVRLQTVIKGSKVKLANIRIGPGGEPRLVTSELPSAYDSKLEPELVKKAVDEEIALKTSLGSVIGFSGRVQAAGTGVPLAGASLVIENISASVQTDSNGNFTLTPAQGVLTAGDYIVSMSGGGYEPQSRTVTVSSFDYGFIIESIVFNAVEKPNTPPSLSIKSVSGSSQNISIVFDLFDAENDPCQIDVYYSLNGGYSYLPTSSASGALSNAYSGANLSAVWFSASDFLSEQASVRIKLIPRDYRSAGQAGESAIFAVNNKIVDPENNPPVIMGVVASGERSDISIKYDLMDQDGDSCAVELYYSTDGGITFTRSANYSLYGRREFPATGLSLAWNSALDFQSEEKNVKIMLTPNDSRSSGTSGESSVFYVNNIKNTPPVIQNLSVSGNYKDIGISYDLIELDGHLCTIEIAFSLDGGTTYLNTSNLSGETSSVAAGQAKTLTWRSYLDFTSVNKTVFIKATPSDKYGYGTEAVFGPFAVYNGGVRPEISRLAVSGNSNIIGISYELKDIDASPCTVEVYYSRDGGSSFVQTGYVEGDISAVAPGANKTVKWNSYGDFRTHEKSVIIKLLPIDDFGAGTEAVSISFEVNNNINRPTIANLLTRVNSGEVEITYDVDDLDASTCHVQFQYATEVSGGYLNSIFVTGETAEVFPGAGKILLWNSKGDFTKNYDSVSVKLIVSDDAGYGGEVISLPFRVYNNSSSEIFINSVAGSSQNITVDFNLTDAEGDPSTIEVYYSRDGGASFIKTANVTGSISNVNPANNLKLVWESAKDLVNQNASGVMLKLAVIDSKGAVQNFNVSQPFAVNNYVPPPVVVPVLNKAEMISGKKIKLTFSTNISVSNTQAALEKITLDDLYFEPGIDTLEYSGQFITITVNSTSNSTSNGTSNFSDILPVAQSEGITVGETHTGLKILAGNGIRSNTGTEASASAAGNNILPDTTPPDELTAQNLSFLA